MAEKRKPLINTTAKRDYVSRQFKNLDFQDPSLWPILPRALICIIIVVFVAALAWFLKIQEYSEALDQEHATEVTLRQDYLIKMRKAVSLELLKKQREQVLQYVMQLEKQLPSKAEMSALLSDINQAGIGRSLQFELFRPGQVIVRDYYAELPIAIRVTGNYHDMGAFAADIANLSRIVTLSDLGIVPKEKDGSSLSMDATARTFRYLDAEEVEAQRASKKVPAK